VERDAGDEKGVMNGRSRSREWQKGGESVEEVAEGEWDVEGKDMGEEGAGGRERGEKRERGHK